MTQTAGAAADAAPLLGRGVRALRAVAIASCLPCITLKILWIAGNRTGIPDGSTLLDQRVRTALANGASVVLDAAVVVLALLLTRPWGRRVPAWLLVLPMWVAAGLLAPIMIGYPLQLAASVGDGSRPAPSNSEPFLDAWVFGVVYSGFILQGPHPRRALRAVRAAPLGSPLAGRGRRPADDSRDTGDRRGRFAAGAAARRHASALGGGGDDGAERRPERQPVDRLLPGGGTSTACSPSSR